MYSVQLLDRSCHGRHVHLLQAWDAASRYLRAGWLRVAIVRAENPAEIVMVLGNLPRRDSREVGT